MKGSTAFLFGLVVGAVGVGLWARPWSPVRDPGLAAVQDTARRARATADSAKHAAAVLVDSLAQAHRQNAVLLARVPRVRPGPTPGTVTIEPTDTGDTTRTVPVPPEVVAELAAQGRTIASLRDETALAQAATGRLIAAAAADSVADETTARAHLREVAELTRQLGEARRSARVWKIAGAAVLVLVGVREMGRLLP